MRAIPEFGKFFKSRRMEAGLTLREFCRNHGFDAGNISKIERDILPPPEASDLLARYAKSLRIKEGSDDWYRFHDLAAVARRKLPDPVAENERLLGALPLLCRSLRKGEAGKDELDQFIKTVREAWSSDGTKG